jgi:hypothetical protein
MADRGRVAESVAGKLATFAEARRQTPDDHIELEARLSLGTVEIAELVRGLESAGTAMSATSIVQVGNVLRHDPHNKYIQKVQWVVQTKPIPVAGAAAGPAVREFLHKDVLGETIRVRTPHMWRLSTSREHKVPPFELTGLDMLTRLKVRLGYSSPEWPGWRLDVTLSWQAPGPQEAAKLADMQREKLGDLLAATDRKEFVSLFLHKLQEASALFRGSVELEWVGAELPRADDLGAVDAVLRRAIKADTAAETEYAVVVETLADLVCHDAASRAKRGLKGVLPAAVPLTWATFADLNGGQPLKGWLASAKAEGFQCVVVCGEIVEVAHEAAGKTVWRPECVPRRERRRTIIEGEFIPATEKTGPQVLAFDVLMFDGNSLLRQRPVDRAARVAEAVAAVRQACAGRPDWLRELPQHALPHTPPRAGADPDIEKVVRGLRTTPFPNDGLIFTHPEAAPYDRTRRYKWKPAEECSIDFWLHEVPRGQWTEEFSPLRIMGERADGTWGALGARFEGTVYALMVTANAHIAQARKLAESPVYAGLPSAARAARESQRKSARQMPAFPALFEPPDHPQAHVFAVPRGRPGGDGEYSHEVCELRPRFRAPSGEIVEKWAAGAPLYPDWEFVRVRADRRAIIAEGYYGNYFPFAEDTWYAAKAPFPMAALWGGEVPDRAPEILAGAPAAFVAFVKTRLYRHLAGSLSHVELAARASDDVVTVCNNAPERVLFIAQHSADLLQTLQRVNALNNSRNSRANAQIRVAAALAHLAAPTEEVLALVQQLDFPPAVSIAAHFALASVCGSARDMANFAATCASLAAPGAQLIAVFLDGEAAMARVKEAWTEDGKSKYEISFAGRGGKLSPHGQKVTVRTGGKALEEFAVNYAVVAAAMAKAGFHVEMSKMFSEFLPDFSRESRDAFSQLTEVDRDFVGSLYRAVIWRKR